jgi:hypothetical protein
MVQVVRQPSSKQFIYIQDHHQVVLQFVAKFGSDLLSQAHHALEELDESRFPKQEREGDNQSSLFWLHSLNELCS